jgi:hypothetical protein
MKAVDFTMDYLFLKWDILKKFNKSLIWVLAYSRESN